MKKIFSASALSLSLQLTLFLGLAMATDHPTWFRRESAVDPFISWHSTKTTTDSTDPLYSDYVPETETATDPFASNQFSQKAVVASTDQLPSTYYPETEETTDLDTTYNFLRRNMAKELRLCYETIPFPDCPEEPNKCNKECSVKFLQKSIYGACRSSNLCRCEIRC